MLAWKESSSALELEASAAERRVIAEHKPPIAAVQLLEHEEHNDSVWAHAEKVRSEAFPEREQALDANQFNKHVLQR